MIGRASDERAASSRIGAGAQLMDRLPSVESTQFRPRADQDPRKPPDGPRTRSWFHDLRNRLISGLVFILPIVITFWIVYWVFMTLERFLLNPLAAIVHRIHAWMRHYPAFQDLPDWWYNIGSPVLALILMVATLYCAGLLFRSWVYRTLEWVLLHVPVVATIYRASRNVVASVGSKFSGGADFKRVVLVPFPNAGSRILGLVTNSLHDATTGKTILTVCVLTGLMPPAGFTLFVPEESVTNISWSVNETLQAILSGGMSVPPTIHYFEGLSTPLATSGEILDAQGHALRSTHGDERDNA
jgi:uncharacterized membrane protein